MENFLIQILMNNLQNRYISIYYSSFLDVFWWSIIQNDKRNTTSIV